jgi:DNA replication and repair protein RecF
MEFRHLRLQGFRNFEFLAVDFSSKRHFLCGANAQGKSNCLEALSLVTAMRSFRVRDWAPLARHGNDEWQARFDIQSQQHGTHCLELQVKGNRKKITLDGDLLARIGALLGRFPVVVLGSEDLQLLRGSPGDRRRWLDLTFSLRDPAYFNALLAYNKGLAQRNRLLKTSGCARELESFEQAMATPAAQLVQIRSQGITQLQKLAETTYSLMAEKDEQPTLTYQPDAGHSDADAFVKKWHAHRSGDIAIGSTRSGPHRDDLRIAVEQRAAKEYGSDGQQRSLVMALRFAQSRLWETALGETPVLLVDDVLGELDPHRRKAFWSLCSNEQQVIASGTSPPPQIEDWQMHRVIAGKISMQ